MTGLDSPLAPGPLQPAGDAEFASSAVSLRRAGQKGTALALADTQMEWYRRLTFTGIRINGSEIPSTGSYTTAHAGDSA